MVLFDYEKQQDDELSLKVGDVITDVEQVCERYLYSEFHIWVNIHVCCKKCTRSCLKQCKLHNTCSKWNQLLSPCVKIVAFSPVLFNSLGHLLELLFTL